MEETPTRGEWLCKNRKPIAVIIIMFIVFPSIIVLYNFSNNSNTEFEISYNVTAWILPLEEEFWLNLDFYDSQQNAEAQVNRYQRIQLGILPLSDEEHHLAITNSPEGLPGFWVMICFDLHEGEPYTILNAGIGHNATTSLLGREISILIEPWQ